MSVANHA
jgi:hypothetical protein